MNDAVLSVRDLSVQVATPSGAKMVLEGLSFDLSAGETLCLAGESGSGKSMTALAIMGCCQPMCRIAGGSINWAKQNWWACLILGIAKSAPRGLR